jgi:hypothetical protein
MMQTRTEIELRIQNANARAAATRYGLGNVPHGFISLGSQINPTLPNRKIESVFANGKMTAITASEGQYKATRYVPTKHSTAIQADFMERGLEWFKRNHAETKSQFDLWVELRRIILGE